MINELVKFIVPHGLVAWRRNELRAKRIGIRRSNLSTKEACEAAANCRYDLWGALVKREKGLKLIDVGANNGDFITALTKITRVEKGIIIEPLPRCFNKLKEKFAVDERFRLHHTAVGANHENIMLNITDNSRFASTLRPSRVVQDNYGSSAGHVVDTLKVPCSPIDTIAADIEYFDLLKIDVQGFEIEVLKGAKKTIKRTHLILIEINYTSHYEGSATFDEVHSLLVKSGFMLRGVSEPFVGQDGPLWADAVYLNRNYER